MKFFKKENWNEILTITPKLIGGDGFKMEPSFLIFFSEVTLQDEKKRWVQTIIFIVFPSIKKNYHISFLLTRIR